MPLHGQLFFILSQCLNNKIFLEILTKNMCNISVQNYNLVGERNKVFIFVQILTSFIIIIYNNVSLYYLSDMDLQKLLFTG